MSHFASIGQIIAEILPFVDFSKWRLSTMLDFLKFRNCNSHTLRSVNVRYHAKFCADRSRRCGDMAVFVFFQDGGRPPSLIFKKLEILTAYTLRRAKVRYHAQFCVDRSNRCGDMAIFPFF